jgi:hypothetical protein
VDASDCDALHRDSLPTAPSPAVHAVTMDEDMMAAMGFAGFGKAKTKRTLDPGRFDKTRREEVTRSVWPHPPSPRELTHASAQLPVPAAVPETRAEPRGPSGPSTLNAAVRPPPDEGDDDGSDDDAPRPPPPPPAHQREHEFDPDAFNGPSVPRMPDEDDADGDADAPLFPTTHQLLLKDHTKVVSALALDPSGARVLSGSHDYDCKLWDFGGMDWRCRPFKTWEPAGMYYVSFP